MFDGLGRMIVIGFIAIVLLVIIGVFTAADYLFVDDTYECKKPITPDLVIDSKTVNGVPTSDTTYIYHLD